MKKLGIILLVVVAVSLMPGAAPSASAGEWDPWEYDTDSDGIVQKVEAIHAIQDYFSQKISKAQAIEVIMLYFG